MQDKGVWAKWSLFASSPGRFQKVLSNFWLLHLMPHGDLGGFFLHSENKGCKCLLEFTGHLVWAIV